MHAASLHQVIAMPGRVGQIFVPVILVRWMLIILPDTFDDEKNEALLVFGNISSAIRLILEMVWMS